MALVHKDWNMEAEAYAAFYPVLDAGNVDVLFCGHVSIDPFFVITLATLAMVLLLLLLLLLLLPPYHHF